MIKWHPFASLLLLLVRFSFSLARGLTSANGSHSLRRHLEETVAAAPPPTQVTADEPSNDPHVFWGVNIFICCILIAAAVWYCCFGGAKRMMARSNNGLTSDQLYAQQVLQRRQRRELARQMTPEERKKAVLMSIQRNQVKMVVTENDLCEDSHSPDENQDPELALDSSALEDVDTDQQGQGENGSVVVCLPLTMSLDNENETSNVPIEHEHSPSTEAGDVEDDFDMTSHTRTHGHLMLRHKDLKSPRSVPNCCAVCLMAYEPGEAVVWSSNPDCLHAFHEECLLDWLVHSNQEGTPCPCCRQSFTDLVTFRKERKIRWAAGRTFDTTVVSF